MSAFPKALRQRPAPGAGLEALEPRLLLSTTIFSEGFEGAFPGPWSVNYSAGRRWAETEHAAHAGGRSGHCAETWAGAETNNYVNYMFAYMSRTVNLSDYTSARLGFWYTMNTEPGADVLRVKANGATLWQVSGASPGWTYQAVDLGAYAGRSYVSLSFEFTSNWSVVPPGDSGVWLDDIVLEGEPIPEWPDAPFAGADLEDTLYVNQDGDAAVSWKVISPYRDFDGYRVAFGQAGPAVFETTGWMDTKVAYYDGPGQPDSAASDGGSRTNARLAASVPAGQEVAVGVRGDTSTTVGGYGLTVDGPAADVAALAIDPEFNLGQADGTVAGPWDAPFYRFTVPAYGTWRVTVAPSGAWDATLNVYDAAGRPVGGSFTRPMDAGGAGAAETWTGYGLRAGADYYVRVDGNGSDAGDFRLSVQGPPVPDLDDQIREAHPVTVGDTVAGYRIMPADDVDMFSFTAAAGQRVGLDVDLPPGSDLDSYLRLFNWIGTELARSDDGAGPVPEASSLESYLEYTFAQAGTYYVGVSGYGNSRYSAYGGWGDAAGSTGAYTLVLATVVPDLDPDDEIRQAVPLALGVARADQIASSTDVDMYAVTVAAGQRLGFDIDRPSGRLDSWIRLFDASGAPLAASDDDAGPAPEYSGLESYLEYAFADAGTYYLGVSGYGNSGYDPVDGTGDAAGSTGAYTITVEELAPLPPPSPGQFDVQMTLSGLTPSQTVIFEQAADRWEQIILGDIPDASYNGQPVDDVLIAASAVYIDGPGGILGQAGPTHVRSGSYLPVRGIMQFDTADLASMESGGLLDEVVLHEMAHILGFGTIWTYLGLVSGYYTSDPQFIGPQAVAEYNAIFGLSVAGVPLEAGGGSGTARSHWRESVFDNELMTGWIDAGYNPLSRITLASMADLGYVVDLSAADPYTPPVLAGAAVSAASPVGGGGWGGGRRWGPEAALVLASGRAPAPGLLQAGRRDALDRPARRPSPWVYGIPYAAWGTAGLDPDPDRDGLQAPGPTPTGRA